MVSSTPTEASATAAVTQAVTMQRFALPAPVFTAE